MAFRIPTPEDLQRMAAANCFELTEDEMAGFRTYIPKIFGSYEILDRMPEPREPLRYRDRDPGYRPSPQEDPFNAIVRRCTLKGAHTGRLAGKRFGLKNNISVAGMPMSCGSLVLDGYVPETDATIVTRLLDAGAEIVATLNMDNFAFSGAGDTSAQGAVLNPHNPEHLAGGVLGWLRRGAILRRHRHHHRRRSGRLHPDTGLLVWGSGPQTHPWAVPYTGIAGFDNSFDHAGPMARTAADAALTLEVIAGKDPLDPRQGDIPVQAYTQALKDGVRGLRIGILAEGFGLELSEPDVEEAVRKAQEVFNELGA